MMTTTYDEAASCLGFPAAGGQNKVSLWAG